MFLHPEMLLPLAGAIETFANLHRIDSAAQVEALFNYALTVISPERRPELQRQVPVSAFRDDQAKLREWLAQLAGLDPSTPRRTDKEAQRLRAELSPLLDRLSFVTTVEFAAHGAELRLFPRVVGVEAAMYLICASALEHEPAVRVLRCAEKGCKAFVIQTTGRGKPRRHCRLHSIERKKAKREDL